MERTVTLIDGLKVGDQTVTTLVVRAPTAGDLLDAQEASERPVATPDGWKLLASDTRMGMETLRRQIKQIGDDSGPMELDQLKKLSAADLDLVRGEADAIDAAINSQIAEEMKSRGRSESAGVDDSAG